MRVLVTGGAGFIGSHLVDSFLAEGHQVTVLDNFSTGRTSNLEHHEGSALRNVTGSILDADLVDSLVKESDQVWHMAAALGVKRILEQPMESIRANVHGSEVVLTAAATHGKRTLIASTSEVYGKTSVEKITEDTDRVVGSPLTIRWIYSEAKALEESIAKILHDTQGLAVTIARLFNTVGPRQTGHYGMVVPRFVSAALKNDEITVYGDGTQTRVFCHVLDAVQGMRMLMADESTAGDVFNVGGEGPVSIRELADRVKERTKSQSTISCMSYEDAYGAGFEDMQRRVPDTSKLRARTGWAPQRTLDDIIDDVAEYQQRTGLA